MLKLARENPIMNGSTVLYLWGEVRLLNKVGVGRGVANMTRQTEQRKTSHGTEEHVTDCVTCHNIDWEFGKSITVQEHTSKRL